MQPLRVSIVLLVTCLFVACENSSADDATEAAGGTTSVAGSSASGGAGSGGKAGSAGASGSSAGGNVGAAGEASGGTAGDASAGAGGGGELCASRSGGAMIDFEVGPDTLRVWIENDVFIDAALEHLANQTTQVPVFDELVDGRDCDEQWTWHPNAEQVSFADFTTEVCDGLPSYIEDNKQEWLSTVMNYCPWSAVVTAVDDRR